MFTVSVVAQKKAYKAAIFKANDYIAVDNYVKATAIYDSLLVKFPDDAFIEYKAGECYLLAEGRLTDAIKVLEQSVAKLPVVNKKSVDAIEARFYLGQAYHLHYDFEKALEVFQKLRIQIPVEHKEALDKIDREIGYNNTAIELKKTPVEFKIKNLGPDINTAYDEHSPVVDLYEDILIYTSNRKNKESERIISGYSDENIYFSLWRDGKWTKAKGTEINNQGSNATIGISPDGGTLLLYQNDGSIGNIYSSSIKNYKWGELEKLPAPINTMYNETHASFSMDGNTIFFSSDRAGGYGGKDIYSVSKLPGGEWGEVRNLGPGINTELDEEGPYIHPNGNKLYFSSEAHQSMGGFDIFVARKDSTGEWNHVKNVGYPINTPFDDLFYAPTLDEQRVYYASKREDGYGGSDIYLLEFPGDHPNSLAVVGGFVYSEGETPAEGALITVYNIKTGEKEGVYRPSVLNGKYICIIPADGNYRMEINLDGYKTFIKDFVVPDGNAFARRKYTFYLDPIVLEKE